MTFRSYLEDEDDKPYYHANTLAFYYEELARKKSEIDILAKRVEGHDAVMAERLREWNGQLETFPAGVTALLEEWVADGSLNHVIDTALIDQKIAPLTAQVVDNTSQVEDNATKTEGMKSVKSKVFNAKGDGVTDDNLALQKAFDSLVEGETLIIPKGKYVNSKVITISKHNINIQMYGELIGKGIKFIGNDLNLEGLRVSRVPIWDDGEIGFDFENVNNSTIYVEKAAGFTKGVQFHGNNKGVSYNNFHFNLMLDNKFSLYCLLTGTGWVNENTFHQGRFAVDPAYRTANNGDKGWAVYFDKGATTTLNVFNNNRFISPSFEFLHNGMYLGNTSFVTLITPRFENVTEKWVHQTSDSKGLIWLTGYNFPSPVNSLLEGASNAIIGMTNSGNTLATNSGISLDGLNAYPKLSKSVNGGLLVTDTDGKTLEIGKEKMGVPNGWGFDTFKLTTNTGNQIFHQNSLPATGTFKRGDIILKSNVPMGSFMGWIKRWDSSTNVEWADWMPFGQVGYLSAITSAPTVIGQEALIGGIWYKAIGTSTAADWKQITN